MLKHLYCRDFVRKVRACGSQPPASIDPRKPSFLLRIASVSLVRHPRDLTLLREIMEKEGYQVHTATSSQSALDTFKVWSYRIFKYRTWTG